MFVLWHQSVIIPRQIKITCLHLNQKRNLLSLQELLHLRSGVQPPQEPQTDLPCQAWPVQGVPSLTRLDPDLQLSHLTKPRED